MQISFRELNDNNELFLSEILEESFNSDSELAFGKGIRLGPPGYDDGTLSKKILNNALLTKLIINADGKDCGVLIYTKGNPNIIDYFCLDPSFIGMGIGSMAWKIFEKNKNEIWQVETPDFSLRNHHFYEKNGFKKIDEKVYESNAVSFIYRKNIAN